MKKNTYDQKVGLRARMELWGSENHHDVRSRIKKKCGDSNSSQSE